MKSPKRFLPHIIALVAIFLLNVIYFYPAYTGKQLEQDDIQLGKAKSKQIRDYREKHGEEPLWTNSMFSGMPTFQANIKHYGNLLAKVEALTKLGQPAHIGLILVLMAGFYFLLSAYKVNPWLCALGAAAFGFSSFFIIGFDAGHNAKLRAAGYMAPMLMGIILTFRGKRWLGVAFTALFAGLALNANHIQITYYSVLIAAIIAIVEFVKAYKSKQLRPYFMSIGVLLVAAILAIGPNTAQIWTTYEYMQETIRGGASASGLDVEQNQQKGGLDKDYAMRWSYGKVESLNLVIPNVMGGGSSQNYEGTQTHNQYFDGIKSNLMQQGYSVEAAKKRANRQIASLFYWGDQQMVNGAYYMGATLFFFFVLGLFLIKDRRRTWIVASVVLALLMAWGKNLAWFNNLLFEYLPLYNKFRTPSMTLVIFSLLFPLMAILCISYIINNYQEQKTFIRKSLLKSFYITGGLFLFIALLGPSLFDFQGSSDSRLSSNPQLLNLLIEDRKDLAQSSAFRSFLFAGLCFVSVLLFIYKRINKVIFMACLSALILIDLWSFDKEHISSEDFVTPKDYSSAYAKSTADRSILQDTGYYRVFNLQNPFNDAMTSYHHKSIGGYHAAKLQRYQELYENALINEQRRISQGLQKNRGRNMQKVFTNTPVLNMLNGKYIIYNPQAKAIQNRQIHGHAWLVENLKVIQKGKELISRLSQSNTGKTAFTDPTFSSYLSQKNYNGEGIIQLNDYGLKEISYTSNTSNEQFAVFSEIYYRGQEGDWQAYIDGKEVKHIRVNYVLRGMKIPSGQHTITFKFRPQAFYAGNQISLYSSITLFVVFIAALVFYFKSSKTKTHNLP